MDNMKNLKASDKIKILKEHDLDSVKVSYFRCYLLKYLKYHYLKSVFQILNNHCKLPKLVHSYF